MARHDETTEPPVIGDVSTHHVHTARHNTIDTRCHHGLRYQVSIRRSSSSRAPSEAVMRPELTSSKMLTPSRFLPELGRDATELTGHVGRTLRIGGSRDVRRELL